MRSRFIISLLVLGFVLPLTAAAQKPEKQFAKPGTQVPPQKQPPQKEAAKDPAKAPAAASK